MKRADDGFVSRLLGRAPDRTEGGRLQPFKLDLIDKAFARIGARSFVDLGGVWAVEGGYLFHGAAKRDVRRAILIDENLTIVVRNRAASSPNVTLLEANFGSPATADLLEPVDAVLLLDVLLHQVKPNWDEILATYAPRTRSFVIVNPQWTAGSDTVRLVDLGREKYLASVPHLPEHDVLFDRLDEINPQRARPWRDVHDVWQWGITDADLISCAAGLGFRLIYYEDEGAWRGLESFANRAFVFLKE